MKEAVNRALLLVTSLEPQVEDRVTQQVEQLAKSIQQLQQRIAYLELCTVPDTP